MQGYTKEGGKTMNKSYIVSRLFISLSAIEEYLDEWSGVNKLYCPETYLPLKLAQEELEELIKEMES